jgi:hypothetical protein
MQFMMPEKALPEHAEVAVLLGLHQKLVDLGSWSIYSIDSDAFISMSV